MATGISHPDLRWILDAVEGRDRLDRGPEPPSDRAECVPALHRIGRVAKEYWGEIWLDTFLTRRTDRQ